MNKYDIVVIGGGSGGLTVAAGASSLGAKVALIEKEKQPGGDCLHYGCVPSKALIQAAKEAYSAKAAAREFGLNLEGKPDLAIAKRRVEAAIADIQKHDDADRFRSMGVDVYEGIGSFKDDHHVMINEETTIYGKRIVIATGSSPVIPPIEGLETVDYLTNETIFQVSEAPKKLIVIGGGVVGLELAQAYARFGSMVTVIDPSNEVMKNEDAAIRPYAKRALEKEMNLELDARVTRVEKSALGQIVVSYERNGQTEQIEGDALLIATGRKPTRAKLHLDRAGVETKDGHVVVTKTLQTTTSHIYAVGDVVGTFPFTHAAGLEGKVVIANAVFGLKRKINYDHVPWVTYTDPEVFHLGMTEEEAKETLGEQYHVYGVETKDVDRFVAERYLDGYLKVLTNSKGQIIGAHAIGPNASDWMQEIVYAKQHGHKIGQLSNVIHPYPTRAAGLQKVADQYWRKKLFDGVVPKLAKKYIQWFR